MNVFSRRGGGGDSGDVGFINMFDDGEGYSSSNIRLSSP